MILLNNNFEHKVEFVNSDVKGNYIILDINIEGQKFTLVNLYEPNDDKPKFYKEIRQKYNVFQNCLCWGFMAQSTQWGHVKRSQFT